VLSLLLLAPSANRASEDFFRAKVEPVLRANCFECHSHEHKIKGGLALDSRSGWEKGGDTGPAVIPGNPESSLLIKAVSHVEKDLQMPPKKRISDAEIALLTGWVKSGAADPRAVAVQTAAKADSQDGGWQAEFQKRLDWWSLKAMRKETPPETPDAPHNPVDRFVRARLHAAGLASAPRAEPAVLLRRASLVLTGLPPAPAEVEAFLADPTEAAYHRVLEQILQSPHFGERFARHWLDVVRYTDTYGYEWDNPAKGSWEYRDYVIRAFNDDLGFDRFLKEQLAGDLLPGARIHSETATVENLIGPMFYHLGEHRHGSSLMFNGIHQDMVNNKIDAFSKAFLATSVACARCHDHKLEAVSQRDYYALAAVFTTPRWTTRVIDAPGRNTPHLARLREVRNAIRGEIASLWKGVTFSAEACKAAVGDPPKNRPRLHEIEYPFARLATTEDHAATWAGLRAEWETARTLRLQENAAYSVLSDFTSPTLPAGWVAEGEGIEHGFVSEATPLVALEGGEALASLLPAGCHTHALSSKLPGSLRTPPQLAIPGNQMSVKIGGGEFGGYLVVDDHAFQNETVAFLTGREPEWKTFADAPLKNGVQQVAIEFTTSALNPNFPPRTGLSKGLKNEDPGHDKRSWLSLTRIVSHDKTGPPPDTLEVFATLYAGTLPSTEAETWTRIGEWCRATVKRWTDGTPEPGDAALLNWLLTKQLLPNKPAPGSELFNLVAEYRAVEESVSFPRTVNSMDERETVRTHYPLNLRGNVDAVGPLVAPDFLAMFASRNAVAASGDSGRLALAESLVEPEHPLTARVYVNRVWHWVFGTGMVATPDDFGRLGDKPSHPELLDWLARDFAAHGWSTKHLLRRMLSSETFCQSGGVSEAAREKDPANRLLHHYPTRRMEAEAIRDSLLRVAGALDPALYGKPVEPPRAKPDPAKRLFSGPLDGNGRRSMYLKMSIMDPPRFLVSFNLPDLKLPTGRRDVANTPLQALSLLNDPFVQSMAQRWARSLVADGACNAETRLRSMFLAALNRPPSEAELQRWNAALARFDAESAPPGQSGAPLANEAAWTQIAHAFFNAKEFLYYR
jgi:hypothetical protein